MLHNAPLWQANYKSMSRVQLVAELQQIAKRPHIYPDCVERKTFVATELAIKSGCEPAPIILLEADETGRPPWD